VKAATPTIEKNARAQEREMRPDEEHILEDDLTEKSAILFPRLCHELADRLSLPITRDKEVGERNECGMPI
ncbi:hypothetical protein ABTB06_19940, partial [Acinetobacter baumannii]